MKISKSFITNSSSSSFIVGFKSIPEKREDILKAVFPNGETTFGYDWGEQGFGVAQVAETILNDVKSQSPNDKEKIDDELKGNCWVDVSPMDYKLPDGTYDWDKYREIYDKESERLSVEYMKEFYDGVGKEPFLYIFEYCDNDGAYFTALEHGDLFKSLPHIRINKH